MVQFAQEEDSVKLLARYGSKLDNTIDLLSDLDFFILTEDVEKQHTALYILKPYYRLSYEDGELLFVIPDSEEYDVRKIDVTISKNFEEIYRLLKEGDDLSNAIFVDKENKHRLNGSFLKERERQFAQVVEDHVCRFIEGFGNLRTCQLLFRVQMSFALCFINLCKLSSSYFGIYD